jgi:TPR repeat protein
MRWGLWVPIWMCTACSAPAEVEQHAGVPRAVGSTGATVAPSSTALCMTAKLCETQCDAGSVGACTRFGQMLMEGAGTAQNLTSAMPVHEKACRLGDGDGCADLAGKQRMLGKPALEIKATAEKGCTAGSARACVALLALPRQGYVPRPDDTPALEARAQKLAGEGCEKGRADDCGALAALDEWAGREHAAAGKRRTTLLEQGCHAGDPLACSQYAEDVRFQDGKNDTPEAVAVLERGCELSVRAACATLAGNAQSGTDREQQLAKKACALGEAVNCPVSAKVALHRKDCDLGLVLSCTSLASALSLAAAPKEEVEAARRRSRALALTMCKNGGRCFLDMIGSGEPPP